MSYAYVTRQRVTSAIDYLTSTDNQISILQLQTLLSVALNPGMDMFGLESRINANSLSVRQSVAALSAPREPGTPGLNYVEAVAAADDRRKRLLYLTPAGREYIEDALRAYFGKSVDYTSISATRALNAILAGIAKKRKARS